MKTKFTQGEWQISRIYNTLIDINVNGLNICDIGCCGDFNEGTGLVKPNEEERANAYLIAAAPDMYAELESIAISMECEHGVDTNSIYELLAKARGE